MIGDNQTWLAFTELAVIIILCHMRRHWSIAAGSCHGIALHPKFDS